MNVKTTTALFATAGLFLLALPAPAGAGTVAKPLTANSASKPSILESKLYCRIERSGALATYQVINKGNFPAAKGRVFAYTVTAPNGVPMPQTYTLLVLLAPGKSVNMTKALPSKSVGVCSPMAP